VEIADSGCGISPEALPRIFEPFFTTKPKTAHRGVGLAWVYGVVTNHGGVVAVSSRVGQGTSLRVYLPALEKVARGLGGKGDDLRGSESILLVDDEESLLTLGQRVLSSYGYAVQTAPTPQRAIQIMSDEPWRIDLVITDLVMPQMGGRQLVEKLRDISTRFRVLYASGYARPSRGDDQALYLQKPFGSQELLRKVREALQAAAPS
jgi:CheY-like chemotaxis protein